MAGDDHGPWLTLSMIIFLTWSILFYCVRLWAKLRVKTAGADDLAVTCALFLSCACQGLIYTAVNSGYGKRSSSLSADSLDYINKHLYAGSFFYVISVGLTRVASAFVIEQISQHGPHARPATVMAWLSAVWTLVSLLIVAIRPPYSSPWSLVDGHAAMFSRWIAVETSGLTVEFALWLLTIHLVWSLQMRLSRRVIIVGVFGFRLLLFPIVIMRLYYLAPIRNSDVNWSTIPAAILTAGALQFAIMATSLTALKPFLRVFRRPILAYASNSSGGGGGVTGHSAESCETYHKLELFRRVSRQPEASDDSARWRPDHDSSKQSIAVEHGSACTRKEGDGEICFGGRPYYGCANRPPRPTNRAVDDGASSKTDSSERMVIQKTTEVMVHYEDDMPNR